jgi:hypothetical protein
MPNGIDVIVEAFRMLGITYIYIPKAMTKIGNSLFCGRRVRAHRLTQYGNIVNLIENLGNMR